MPQSDQSTIYHNFEKHQEAHLFPLELFQLQDHQQLHFQGLSA